MKKLSTTYRTHADLFYKKTALADTEENTISSALGSWINLAFLSIGLRPKIDSKEQHQLETALGCSLDSAEKHLKKLLSAKPQTVALALGFWNNSVPGTNEFISYLKEIITGSTDKATISSPVPSKKTLDAWVEENSLGILKKFPLDNPQDIVAILANIVATKINWDEPYKTTPEVDEKWGEKLLTQERDANLHIGVTPENKVYAIHWKEDETGTLTVYSAVGDDSLTSEELYNLVVEFEENDRYSSISVEEAERVKTLQPDFLEFYAKRSFGYKCETTVELPAWEADAKYDLDDLNVGFESVAELWSSKHDIGVETIQVAKARYHKEGFEAAALTVTVMRASAALAPNQMIYLITAKFNKPYVVVAFSNEKEFKNLPLFVSQVKKASPVE